MKTKRWSRNQEAFCLRYRPERSCSCRGRRHLAVRPNQRPEASTSLVGLVRTLTPPPLGVGGAPRARPD